MSIKRKQWDAKSLRKEIKLWKETFNPNYYEKKSDIPIATLESFYSTYVSRNTIKCWPNTKPTLYEIFESEVREYVRAEMTQKLFKNNPVGAIFYLKCVFKKEFNDQPLQDKETLTINLNTTNKGSNTTRINKKVETNKKKPTQQ